MQMLKIVNLERFLNLDMWYIFQYAEWTVVMLQQVDYGFIDFLNSVRIGNIDENVEEHRKQSFVEKPDERYPNKALHTFGENQPKSFHNKILKFVQVTRSQVIVNTYLKLLKLLEIRQTDTMFPLYQLGFMPL